MAPFVTAGRIYLNNLDMYKIDGGSFHFDTCDYFKLDIYGGLPVSYYSNLKTSLIGAAIEVPVTISGTKIRAEYNYFIHEDGGDFNTHTARGRIDQSLSLCNHYSAHYIFTAAA